ncbi:MAG: hypothetical protein IJQ81_07235 [Oscillibacter sp.]|nr:hypothetical protein [Oscillibacter sp.]
MKRYYIGGRQYVPEKSTELCAYDGIMGKAALYRTVKGAFFLVDEREGDGVSARVVEEREAFAFMDAHPDCVNTENYDAVFGEPEEG